MYDIFGQRFGSLKHLSDNERIAPRSPFVFSKLLKPGILQLKGLAELSLPFITFDPLSEYVSRQQLSISTEETYEFFNPSDSDVAEEGVRALFKDLREDIAAAGKKPIETYRLTEKIEVIIETLQERVVAAEEAMQQIESRLSLFLESLFAQSVEAQLGSVAGLRKLPALDSLALLVARRDSGAALFNLYPEFSKDSFRILRPALVTYLMQKAELQQQQRLLKQSMEIREHQQPPSPDIINAFCAQMLAQYAYKESDALAGVYALLEVTLDLRLRREQVDNIDRYASSQGGNAVNQMIMGAGKTSVLQPILSFLFVFSGGLSVVNVPDEHYALVAQNLAKVAGKAFGIYILATPNEQAYRRGMTLSEYGLFYQKLEELKKLSGVFVTTPRQKYAMLASYYEALNLPIINFEHPDTSEAILASTQKICAMMQMEGVEQIDEIHKLSPKEGVFQYTLGKKKMVDFDRGQIVCQLLSRWVTQIINHPESLVCRIEVIDYLLKRTSQQETSHQQKSALTEAMFEAHIKPALVEIAMQLLQEKYAQNQNFNFIHGKKEKLRDYLLQDSHYVVHWLEECAADKEKEKQLIGALALSIDLIKSGLMENYGTQFGFAIGKNREDESDALVARPYEAAHKPKSTRYAEPYKQVVYTMLGLFAEGIKKESAAEMLSIIRKNIHREIQQGTPLQDTRGYQKYVRICGQVHNAEEILNTKHANALIEFFQKQISSNPEGLLWYMEDQVLQQITFYPHVLRLTPSTLMGFNKVCGGYTGTLREDVLSPLMKPFKEIGTLGSIITAVSKKIQTRTSSLEKVSSTDPLAWVKTTFLQNDAFAFIDSGGWLKDAPLKEFLEGLLRSVSEVRKEIEGIVYHNPKGELSALVQTNTGEVKELSFHPLQHDTTSGRFLTIFCQAYETGTNILQPVGARAIISVRKNMELDDFLQAVFRMRGILTHQQLTIGVTEDLYQHMLSAIIDLYLDRAQPGENLYGVQSPRTLEGRRELLKRFTPDFPLDQKMLWRYLTVNQGESALDNNWLAMVAHLRETIERKLREGLLSGIDAPEVTPRLMKMLSSLVIHSFQDQPTQRVSAANPKKIDTYVTNQELKHYQNMIDTIAKDQMLAAYLFRGKNCDQEIKEWRDQLERCIGKGNIRHKIASSTSYGEIEQQQQQTEETQQQLQIDIRQHAVEAPPALINYDSRVIQGLVQTSVTEGLFKLQDIFYCLSSLTVANDFARGVASNIFLSPNLLFKQGITTNGKYHLPANYCSYVGEKLYLWSSQDRVHITLAKRQHNSLADLMVLSMLKGEVIESGAQTYSEADLKELWKKMLPSVAVAKLMTGWIQFSQEEIQCLDNFLSTGVSAQRMHLNLRNYYHDYLGYLTKEEIKQYKESRLAGWLETPRK